MDALRARRHGRRDLLACSPFAKQHDVFVHHPHPPPAARPHQLCSPSFMRWCGMIASPPSPASASTLCRLPARNGRTVGLALDLMEESPWLADRLAVTLINRQQWPGRFLLREGGAVGRCGTQTRHQSLSGTETGKIDASVAGPGVSHCPASFRPSARAGPPLAWRFAGLHAIRAEMNLISNPQSRHPRRRPAERLDGMTSRRLTDSTMQRSCSSS